MPLPGFDNWIAKTLVYSFQKHGCPGLQHIYDISKQYLKKFLCIL
jgi:hypothetical protein